MQRSAIRVALSVGLASVVIVGLITGITVVVIFVGSRADDRPGRRGGGFADRVVDVGDLLPLVVVLGVVGVAVLSVVAWFVARRAALPLAEALRVQRAFVADASHELRTPLTTLTSRIQLAQHRAERNGDVRSALLDLRQDAAVMDGVLTDLLLAAETAGGPASRTVGVSSVQASAAAASDTLQLRAAAAEVTVAVDIADGLEVAADATALSRTLVALLDNAVRHSPTGGTVRLTGGSSGGAVEVRVSDQGDGIRGVEPDRLFDRFVRSDDGASRRGFGLGLALVRDVAVRFGGDIRVERTSPDGTTFLLTLPAAKPRNG